MDDIVKSIQEDILRPEVGLNTILLKAKVLTHQLKNHRLKRWVNYELDGYPHLEKVPEYRIIYTPLLGYIFNGYNGYKNIPIPLDKTPDWFQETANKIHFCPGIKTVEEYAVSQNSIITTHKEETWQLLTNANSKYKTKIMQHAILISKVISISGLFKILMILLVNYKK